VNESGSTNKLTQKMEMIGVIRMSDSYIDNTPDKITTTHQIRQGITIRSTEENTKLHMSLKNMLIPKRGTSKEIMHILFLENKEDIRAIINLSPKKKVTKMTKIRHKKLLMDTNLDKGNLLKNFASDDQFINI
jgi:hypothetical protein